MSDERLTKINIFRSTEEERWQWDLVALDAEMTISTFLREAANEYAERLRGVRENGGDG